ncbi:MAG: rRNA pseudouridine synthase [Oscillospiraceae bacterium]|nr:rRNA pseudouridine synthase [Oscillospiraceae bacterium]MBQ8732318.1 rRNA pseudouridine synthase [Oscillospiraceae bacterium]
MEKKLDRIQKVIADSGYTSRRKAEELIEKGQVTVNGRPALIGMKVDPRRDVIAISGERLELRGKRQYYYIMLHKPRGYLTSMEDDRGRKCVTELVEDIPARVYPVGRLDRNSEGLLLMTDDGAFANQIIHPRSHMPRVYRVTVRPEVTEEQVSHLSVGVTLDGGEHTLPATVHVISSGQGRSVMEIVIREGKNRQIRRMCEAVGLEVARLKRTAIGPLKLGMLQPGQWRELKKEELAALRRASDSQKQRQERN